MIKDRVTSILQEMFGEVNDKSELLDSGIIDSFGMLDLIDKLESEFGILVDAEDIIPENFLDIRAITELVLKYENER